MERSIEEINVKCPHCGSDKMTIDCNIIVTAVFTPNKEVRVKNYWNAEELTTQVSECSSDDLQGFCEECGQYCDFSWDAGFCID